MHANDKELLAIRDGEANDMRNHVENCDECQQKLTTLDSIAEKLFECFDSEPSDHVWASIQESMNERDNSQSLFNEDSQTVIDNNVVSLKANNMHALTRSIYALAASIAFVGVFAIFMFTNNSQNQQTQLLQASINQLMTNSRGLEQSLQQVALQNQTLSNSNQQIADRLYWRLTHVDQLIQAANPDDSDQMKTLWNNRIEALNALNKLYFEREGVVAASEIYY